MFLSVRFTSLSPKRHKNDKTPPRIDGTSKDPQGNSGPTGYPRTVSTPHNLPGWDTKPRCRRPSHKTKNCFTSTESRDELPPEKQNGAMHSFRASSPQFSWLGKVTFAPAMLTERNFHRTRDVMRWQAIQLGASYFFHRLL
jgi:hypothetical protein